MKVVEIGKTAESRPQLMAIITSPENHKKLERYKEISRRLATVDGLTDEQAHALAREGKGVVWIDGGLHATEVLGAHQLIETVYQLVSRTDPETTRFLNDLIILAVHANPDGMELVSSWACARRSRPGDPAPACRGSTSELHRPRQQSRLLPVVAAGKHEHEPGHVSGVVPPDHERHHQTGPARSCSPRRSAIRSTTTSIRSSRPSSTWWPRRCTAALRRKESPVSPAARDRATRRGGTVDCGRWRISTTWRAPDRNDWQPDAHRDPVPAAAAPARLEPAFPDRAAGMALQAVDRLLHHGELGARHRVQEQRELPLQHLPDGEELD